MAVKGAQISTVFIGGIPRGLQQLVLLFVNTTYL